MEYTTATLLGACFAGGFIAIVLTTCLIFFWLD